MPIVFIHGVCVRATPDYYSGVSQRKEMFEKLVVQKVKNKYPALTVADEVFWGHLGVQLRWDLRSMFGEDFRPMGGDKPPPDVPFLEFVDLFANQTKSADKDTADALLLAAAKEAPEAFMAALMATERDRYAPTALELLIEDVSPRGAKADAEQEGRLTARLLIAADEVGRTEAAQIVKGANSGKAAVDALLQAVAERLRPATKSSGASMGPITAWVTDRLHRIHSAVQAGALQARNYVCALGKEAVSRATALVVNTVANKAAGFVRSPNVAPLATLFFGDIFEYLRRGHDSSSGRKSIAPLVRDEVRGAAGKRTNQDPLVVVTHSFGGMIFYDLLTSDDTELNLKSLQVDLWVTAGSQVALFAEMAMFRNSPLNVPNKKVKFLQLPSEVKSWVNFFDHGDLLSFQAHPVFGRGSVEDIPMPGKQAVAKAHSAYFSEPFFYHEIAKRLETLPTQEGENTSQPNVPPSQQPVSPP
jgi:hypothetical protein